MTINDRAWEDFVLLAQVCMLNDTESDFYDVFDVWRRKLLSGQPYSEEFLEKIDAEIAAEELRNARSTDVS